MLEFVNEYMLIKLYSNKKMVRTIFTDHPNLNMKKQLSTFDVTY